MSRRLLLAAALAAGSAASAAPAQEAFVRAVDAEPGVDLAVCVLDLDGGEVFAHRADESFVLASNTKLLTTAAALTALGPEHRWHTRAWLADGELWLAGDGDPSLRRLPSGDADEAFLDALAAALRAAGAEPKAVVVDGRAFPGPPFPPLWPADQRQFDYSAPVSALAVEGNVLELRLLAGGEILLDPDPGPALELVRRPRPGRVFSAVWTGDLALRLEGDLARPATGRLAVRAPLRWFGTWVRAGLAARGLACGPVRLPAADEPAPAGPPLLDHPSAWTLADAVLLANKESDNFTAEVLLRTLGRERGAAGTAAAGAAAVAAELERLGLDPAGLHQVDGSGFARGGEPPANSAPARLVAGLLAAMAQGEHRRLFFDSLLVGGEDGRLARWFRDRIFQPRRVRAKTGFITGASTLSGYLLAGDEVLVFSVLVNFVPDGTRRTNGYRFREVQERILRELLESWPTS
ncbi:MAG: hypothetical protein D6702_03340 [Planctomycetota bacterium]|nr:MAG: hypothetical protein D6702_03340 [Planctomycetota bacterium]